MELSKKIDYLTYADYLNWEGDDRFELIDGVPVMMSPAPGTEHQRISGEIFRQLATYLIGKSCQVYAAPFDVRLNADTADDTVVQPDITVVCDPGKLDARGCKGVPDMTVEVISPTSRRHDQLTKFKKYLQAGVRAYWLVDPETESISTFLLEGGRYISQVYGAGEMAPVSVLDGCDIDLSMVFPKVEDETASDP